MAAISSAPKYFHGIKVYLKKYNRLDVSKYLYKSLVLSDTFSDFFLKWKHHRDFENIILSLSKFLIKAILIQVILAHFHASQMIWTRP